MIGLNAVILAVRDETPLVFIVHGAEHALVPEAEKAADKSGLDALPFGPLEPDAHRTLEIGLRDWVAEQTPITPGYVEQLYTFGDSGRYAGAEEAREHLRVISVGYLALTDNPVEAEAGESLNGESFWQDWYSYFPWEDWREGKPKLVSDVIEPHLRQWADSAADAPARQQRLDRARMCFGMDGVSWDEEKVLERYELMWGAGLVEEAWRKGGRASAGDEAMKPARTCGVPMRFDHRRILATAMGRLRGKLKYRPVIFELMPETFTLFQLQRTIEAISGIRLYKPNFRRLVLNSGLVEKTGKIETHTGGRPAEQYRFRREVLHERPAPGVRLSGTPA